MADGRPHTAGVRAACGYRHARAEIGRHASVTADADERSSASWALRGARRGSDVAKQKQDDEGRPAMAPGAADAGLNGAGDAGLIGAADAGVIGAAVPPVPDPMEQVRDLLFGQAQRQVSERQADLDARIANVEGALLSRIAELEAQIGEVRDEAARERRASVIEIGERITALGREVVASAKPGGSDGRGDADG